MPYNYASLSGKYKAFTDLSVILLILSAVGLYNYDFFHALAEVLNAMVAMGIFMVAWNSRRYITNYFFLFIGVAYLFISLLMLLHVLTYVNNGPFANLPADISDQFWITSLYLFGISFLAGLFFIKKKTSVRVLFIIYTIVTGLALVSIFGWRNFPELYTGGIWSSPFLAFSKAAIALLFLSSILLLYLKRKQFDRRVHQLLYYSLVSLLVSSEIIFIGHTDVFNNYDMVGHLLAVVSSYFFYLGIVEIGLMKPYRLLFRELKDKEVAVRESEKIYRSMVESALDAIVIHNNSGILYINEAGINLFGAANKAWFRDRKLSDFIHPDYQGFFKLRMEDFRKGAKKFPLQEIKVIRSDGSVIDAEIKGQVMNYMGAPAIQSTFRNMSHRTIAIHDAPDHIIMTDVSGKLIYANKAAQKMTGYVWEEMKGNRPSLWGNVLAKSNNHSIGSSLASKYAWDLINEITPTFTGEVVNTRRNGEKYIAELHVSPIKNEEGDIAFFMAIERDITRIKELDQAKTEFLSLAAHELRTPLASISLSSELLLRGVAGAVEPKQGEYLQEIYNSTHRMSELIYTFLNISRIELGTFAISPIALDIAKSVEETLTEAHTQFENKKINLKKDFQEGLPAAKFDRNVLKIAIQNIISNSLRYTPAGGEVRVEIKMAATDILIKISDSGIGIPSHEQNKIFSKSFRADNAKNANTEGLGLGLYIVKSVLKRAGAKIWFESAEGQGTTFFISIPVKDGK